jgi:hypothetical protein
MPVTDKILIATAANHPTERSVAKFPMIPVPNSSTANDGTRPLLLGGFWITLAGLLALLATGTLLGGIGIDGPHTNAGWLAFMFALMGVPFGLMLLVLGVAKWLRNRRNDRKLPN